MSVHGSLGLYKNDVGACGKKFGATLDDVARMNRLLEAHVLHSHEHGQCPAVKPVTQKQDRALSHHLAQHHSGHYGMPREMALKEELISLHFITGDAFTALRVDFVNKEHRLPVRQKLADFFSVHLI